MPTQTIVRLATEEDLRFQDLAVPHPHPTGAQILAAAHATRSDAVLLQRLPSGDLEAIRLSETPDLSRSVEFFLSFGDRTYSLTVNHAQLTWAARHISGATVRKVANIPATDELLLLRSSHAPETVDDKSVVDLGRPGVEKFVTRPKSWKLRVQAVTLEFATPQVKVGDAMTKAGFDLTKAWDIFLLVAGKPKQAVDVNFIVDLTTRGIERIRLMQRNVDNGEVVGSKARRVFRLLKVDEEYLNGMGLHWETVMEGERRWLLLHRYTMLAGYTPETVTFALDIPKDYPQAQVDMFYFFPKVARRDGVEIPSTQVTATVDGATYQGWSRHRKAGQAWDPSSDNVVTQLALVEHCLQREFGE